MHKNIIYRKKINYKHSLENGGTCSSSNIKSKRIEYKLFGTTGQLSHKLCNCLNPSWDHCKHTIEKFELEANNAMLEMLA